ncbi:hypothetical protein EON80_02755 [bacterium]|nr:MAG: hypothetical protein EON80_02755 [bacterium]
MAVPVHAQSEAPKIEAPKIAEPMVFDLVRPLGAKRGELEVNTLAQRNLGGSHRPIEWAPEIEYAFADGYAVELELPLEGRHITDYKLGLQGTFGTFKGGKAIHGIQYLGLHNRNQEQWESSLLYIVGVRHSKRVSTLSMAGIGDVAIRKLSDRSLLFNHTTFYDLNQETTVGLELNVSHGRERSVQLMPQVQRNLKKNLQLQTGLGAIRETGQSWQPRFGLRLIRQLK